MKQNKTSLLIILLCCFSFSSCRIINTEIQYKIERIQDRIEEFKYDWSMKRRAAYIKAHDRLVKRMGRMSAKRLVKKYKIKTDLPAEFAENHHLQQTVKKEVSGDVAIHKFTGTDIVTAVSLVYDFNDADKLFSSDEFLLYLYETNTQVFDNCIYNYSNHYTSYTENGFKDYIELGLPLTLSASDHTQYDKSLIVFDDEYFRNEGYIAPFTKDDDLKGVKYGVTDEYLFNYHIPYVEQAYSYVLNSLKGKTLKELEEIFPNIPSIDYKYRLYMKKYSNKMSFYEYLLQSKNNHEHRYDSSCYCDKMALEFYSQHSRKEDNKKYLQEMRKKYPYVEIAERYACLRQLIDTDASRIAIRKIVALPINPKDNVNYKLVVKPVETVQYYVILNFNKDYDTTTNLIEFSEKEYKQLINAGSFKTVAAKTSEDVVSIYPATYY